jgi:hypothetical protein
MRFSGRWQILRTKMMGTGGIASLASCDSFGVEDCVALEMLQVGTLAKFEDAEVAAAELCLASCLRVFCSE